MFLRKRDYAPHWIACWKDGDRTIERSTKQTNKHKAAKVMARWVAEQEKSFFKTIGKIEFKPLAERWLKVQEPNIKPRTKAAYQEALNRLLPRFGKKIVRDIKAQDVEEFITESAEIYKPRSINFALFILRAVLDYAVKLGYTHTNSAKLVRGPKETSKEQLPSFSLEQLHRLFNVLEGQDKALIQLAGLCGLRLGEILALRWENVDLEAKTLEVRESYGGKKFGVDTPKNEGSRRTVLLTPAVVDALKSHKLQQEQHKRWLKAGEYKDRGLAFADPNGEYIDPKHIGAKLLDPALDRAKLPHIRFHDLRGIAITLMLESGASLKHTMEQAGHKTPAMTLAVYARVTKKAGEKAQEDLQRYVFG